MNEIEIIIIGQGLNFHKKIKTEQLDLTYENDQYKIEVESNKLHQVRKHIIKRIYHRLFRGVRRQFMYFLKDSQVIIKAEGQDKGKEIQIPGEVIYHGFWQSDEAPANIVYIADKTRVIGKAFAELFGRPITSRTIIYIFIVIAVIMVLYLVASGAVTLPFTF